ncbi:MAG: zinc carboxypeptidase [Chloroflexi bacterium]|nr:zinc carboxypeptidase [Chloroflexota bacterium]
MSKSFIFFLLLGLLAPLAISSAQGPEPNRFLVTFRTQDPIERTALMTRGYALWGATLNDITFIMTSEEIRALDYSPPPRIQPLAPPPDFSGYHDYAEMTSELKALAAENPQIARLQSLGRSHEGREIWAMRITDRPDENEPDEKTILIFANMHAREHLTLEQALYLIRDLLENYGVEGEVTNLVNQRDIWIIPNLNPDGTEYDIRSWENPMDPPMWRKNRRNNMNGTWGVDLNRNFSYKWGCCGGSESYSGGETYRGPAPFSEPETQVIRNFANQHPDLTISFSLHTFGELILYPYGYTRDDLPPDMDPTDLAIFKAMSDGLSQRNGYQAEQASSLYIVDGDSDDWLYAERGVYALTWELYPPTFDPGFYPPDDVIPAETARNRDALRYGIALADDPAKSIGAGADMIPPQITILSPTGNEPLFVHAPITVTVAVTDNVGPTTVEYLVDGEPVAVRVAPDFSAVLTLPAGTSELTARAFDAAHWQTLSAPLLLTVIDPNSTPTPNRLYLPLLNR